MRVALVPLDDRPCNSDQIATLARVAQIDLVLPPHELISSHSANYNFECLHDWLDEQARHADAAVVSTDLYLYGGLIRSRKLAVSTAEALQRLDRLEVLIKRHRRCKFYLGSVLLRLSITVNEDQRVEDWRNIFDYSIAADCHQSNPDQETEQRLRAIRALIPENLLNEYLEVRQRNFAVNLKIAEMGPFVQYAIYGQEDCAEFGLHRLEKLSIVEKISRLAPEIRERFLVLTGADELGSMGLMRAYMDHCAVQAQAWPLAFRFLDPKNLALFSSYEDVSVDDNLELHLKASPFRRDDSHVDAPRVHTLTFDQTGQDDLCFVDREPVRNALTPAMTEFLKAIRPGDALLDLTCANGAHPELLAALKPNLSPQQLASFSAWNTTGNRLGTLVAHLGIRETARRQGKLNLAADQFYLMTRLLDDSCYQSRVRARLQRQCLKEGLNAWALGDQWARYSELCSAQMNTEAALLGWNGPIKASLPWPRLFEVRVVEQSGT